MRIHLIKELSINNFCEEHQDRGVSFGKWLTKIKYVDWKDLQISSLHSTRLIF